MVVESARAPVNPTSALFSLTPSVIHTAGGNWTATASAFDCSPAADVTLNVKVPAVPRIAET